MGELRAHAPLLDAYLSFLDRRESLSPFTVPGHKQQTAQIDADLGRCVDVDVPLYGGLDEIKLTRGVLAHAEGLAADLWGGNWARFSTGGSTHGNQALMFAIAKPGAKVAVTRAAHRSLASALMLANLTPIWMMPDVDKRTGFPTGISIETVSKALQSNPVAIVLTEPGYLGTYSDLPAIVELAHKHDVPVIVDQAWGSPFGFHPKLPPHALQSGADAFVTSIHKNLTGYSAASLVVAKSHLLESARLNQGFEATHTTSPAGAPLASIDGTRALLQLRGFDLIEAMLNRIDKLREDLIYKFGKEVTISPDDFDRFDYSKVIIRCGAIGDDGVRIEKELIKRGIPVEMADQDTLIAMVTIADTDRDIENLSSSLCEIIKPGTPRTTPTALSWRISPVQVRPFAEGLFGRSELVSADSAIGRVSADLIAPYPPGVPVVMPGELLTSEIVTGLREAAASGVRIAYSTDATLDSYRVLLTS